MSVSTNYPAIKPSLMLDFANTGSLDPRITFSRASTATYYDGVTTAKAEENLLLRSQEFDAAAWTKTTATTTANTDTAPDGTLTADTFTATSANALLQQPSTSSQTGVDFTFSVWIKRKTGTGVVDIACQVGLGYQTVAVDSTWQRFSLTRTVTVAQAAMAIRLQTSGDEVYVWGAQLEQRSSVTAYTATTTQPITNYIPVLQTAASGVARFDHNPTTGETLGLLIEEQRTNLLTYSSDFSNAAWTKSNATITADTIVAPDGTLTGDKLVEDTNTGGHGVYRGFVYSALTYTYSIRAKAAERTKLRLVAAGSSGVLTNVDLGAGTIDSGTAFGSGWTVVGTSIQNIGNGFYLASITFTAAAESGSLQTNLLDASGNNSYTGNGYNGIYLWGAQLEAGAFPTSYIATTSAQVTRSADAASMTGTNFSSWYNQGAGTLYAEWDRGTTANAASGGGAFVPRIWSLGTTASGLFQLRLYSSGSAEVVSSATAPGVYMASFWSVSGVNKHAVALEPNNNAVSYNGGALVTDSDSAPQPLPDTLSIGANTIGTGNIGRGHIRKVSYYPQRLSDTNLVALTS